MIEIIFRKKNLKGKNKKVKFILVLFRGSGLLVLKYFYFFCLNMHCALVLSENGTYNSVWPQEMQNSCKRIYLKRNSKNEAWEQ